MVLVIADVPTLAGITVHGFTEVEMWLVVEPTGQFVTVSAQLRMVETVVI